MTVDAPEFGIGDLVHHRTPEGDCGIITDIRYSMLDQNWTYEVSINWETKYAYGHELATEKSF